MFTHFHKEVDALKQDLLKMAGLVEEAIRKATAALTSLDASKAGLVIEGDREIDAAQNQIEDRCIKLLGTQQPVAVDLRLITSVMAIINYLEHMGDQAVNIAERSLELKGLDPPISSPLLGQMALLAQEMVHLSLDALVQQDIALAERIIMMDKKLDENNRALLESMISSMIQEQHIIRQGVEIIIAGRHLERIGDEATNIAEEILYLVKGKLIRHRQIVTQAPEDSP